MRHHAFDPSRNAEVRAQLLVLTQIKKTAGEDNRAGVFHPPEARGADNQGQLLVRIRRDRFAKERERRRSGSKALGSVPAILLRDIKRERGYGIRINVKFRAFVDGNNHAVSGNWFALLKLPHVLTRFVRAHREKFSVGNYQIARRRRDGERDCRFR